MYCPSCFIHRFNLYFMSVTVGDCFACVIELCAPVHAPALKDIPFLFRRFRQRYIVIGIAIVLWFHDLKLRIALGCIRFLSKSRDSIRTATSRIITIAATRVSAVLPIVFFMILPPINCKDHSHYSN